MADFTDRLKNVAKAAWSLQYNRMNARWAAGILKGLEAEGHTLPDATRQRCDAYAREVLGAKKYAPWLHVYSCVAGEFREGWMPDNFYGEKVVGQISGAYGDAADLRALNTRLFDAEEFPDVGAFVNGVFVDRDARMIPPGAERDMLFRDSDKVAFKLDQSLQGVGIYFFERDTFDPDAVRRLGNGLFQSFIVQHDDFNVFSPNSVATVRLTTATTDAGEVSLRAGYLRLARDQETHVQSNSALRVAIDLATGDLSDTGYTPGWSKIAAHPDTGGVFAGWRVPNFADCARVVTERHQKMPFVRCIGWDLSVDRDGAVKIIEWNGGHNDIKFGEAIQGPCFRDMNWERFR